MVLLGAIGVGLAIGGSAARAGELLGRAVPVGVFVLISLVLVGLERGAAVSVLRNGRFLRTAVVLNFVVNPLIAWGVSATLLSGQPDLQVGVLLFLLTPCVGWYLMFSELAGGDRSLAVSLLGVNLVLQLITLPVFLAVFVGDVDVPIASVVRSVVVFLVAPGLVALVAQVVLARRRVPPRAVERVLGPAKTASLAFVIVAMFASQADEVLDGGAVLVRIVPPILLFFVAAFGAALVAARAMVMPHEQVVVLAFTATSRNSEASLAIAATAFSDPLVSLAVVLGPVIELPLLVGMLPVLDRLRPVFPASGSGQI